MNELGRRLASQLKIPVDSGIDFGPYAEVKYDGQNLGTVFITHTPGNLIVDTSPGSVNNLRWDYVYRQHSNSLNELVASRFGTTSQDISIAASLFRILEVKDGNGQTLGKVICAYEDDRWSIQDAN